MSSKKSKKSKINTRERSERDSLDDDTTKSKSKIKLAKLLKADILAVSGDGEVTIRGKIPRESPAVRNSSLINPTLVNIGSESSGHTEYHSEITGLSGAIAVVVNDIKIQEVQEGENDNEDSEDTSAVSSLSTGETVFGFPSARTQVSISGVASQGNNTIGKFQLIKANKSLGPWNLIEWKSFFSNRSNHKYFGCCVTDLHYNGVVTFQGNSTDGFFQSYNTHDGSPYGTPNDETTYFLIDSVNTKICWLTGFPLLKTAPLVKGKPGTSLQNPHCEHVLSILDALFELALYENEHKVLMDDYRSFISYRHFDDGVWKNLPHYNLGEFNEFLRVSGKLYEYTDDDLELIERLRMEYLYALPDANLEKDDDSLLAWDGINVTFNRTVASNLSNRIWKRMVVPDGLIDVFGVKGSIRKDVWQKNILLAWEKRLSFIAVYINERKQSNFANLYGIMSICRYLTKLPPIIKKCLLGYQGNKSELELTLYDKEIYLTPSTPFKIALLQNFAVELANICLDNITNATNAGKIVIIKIIFPNLDSVPELFVRRSDRSINLSNEFPKLILKWLSLLEIMKFNKNMNDFLRDNFIFCFYRIFDTKDKKYENIRYKIISIVAYQYKINFINAIISNVPIDQEFLKSKLTSKREEYENKIKELFSEIKSVFIMSDEFNELNEWLTVLRSQNFMSYNEDSKMSSDEDLKVSSLEDLKVSSDEDLKKVSDFAILKIADYSKESNSWETVYGIDSGKIFEDFFTDGENVVIGPEIKERIINEQKRHILESKDVKAAAETLIEMKNNTIEEEVEEILEEGIIDGKILSTTGILEEYGSASDSSSDSSLDSSLDSTSYSTSYPTSYPTSDHLTYRGTKRKAGKNKNKNIKNKSKKNKITRKNKSKKNKKTRKHK